MEQTPQSGSRLVRVLCWTSVVVVALALHAMYLGWARWKQRSDAASRLEREFAQLYFDDEPHPLEWLRGDARVLRRLHGMLHPGMIQNESPRLDAECGDALAAFPECRFVVAESVEVDAGFIQRLAALPRLERLTLRCWRADEFCREIPALRSLAYLSLSGCHPLTDADVVGLKQLDGLVALDLSNTSVGDGTLASSLPPRLEALDLSDTKATGAEVTRLADRPHLHYVVLVRREEGLSFVPEIAPNLRAGLDLKPLLAAGKIVKEGGRLPDFARPRGGQAWRAWSARDQEFDSPEP